jgi:tRNA splicing endonuclease
MKNDEKLMKIGEELNIVKEKLGVAHETIRKMEQALMTTNKKIETLLEEKGRIELMMADIIDEHNISKNETRATTRLKINKVKKYALQRELFLQYALCAIIILVAVIIAMSGLLKCSA